MFCWTALPYFDNLSVRVSCWFSSSQMSSKTLEVKIISYFPPTHKTLISLDVRPVRSCWAKHTDQDPHHLPDPNPHSGSYPTYSFLCRLGVRQCKHFCYLIILCCRMHCKLNKKCISTWKKFFYVRHWQPQVRVDYNPWFKADLSTHFTKNLTSGDAPFGCPVSSCRAVFKTNTDLKRHNKIHTGEKPYQARKLTKTQSSKIFLPVYWFRILADLNGFASPGSGSSTY
jgi:hypothetical protein